MNLYLHEIGGDQVVVHPGHDSLVAPWGNRRRVGFRVLENKRLIFRLYVLPRDRWVMSATINRI
jgi:hypothetical protein